MPFDVQGALNAGYTPEEIGQHVGFDVAGAKEAGYSDQEILAHLSGGVVPQTEPIKPAKQPQKGFLADVMDAGSKRLSSISNPKPSAVRAFSPTLGSLTNVVGQAGGFLFGDVPGSALKAGYEALPKDVQSNIAGVGKLIRTNPVVDATLTAFGALPEGVRNDIENIGNASLFFPAGKAAGALKPVAREGVNIAKDVVTAATAKTPGILDKELSSVIGRGIDKAIRPTVVGKRTSPQTKAYYDKAKTAVKTIVDNKNNLALTDAEGNVTSGLPKTLKQFSEAVDQTKRSVFQQYDDMAKAAGESGVEVDLNPAVKELQSISGNKVLNDLSPEIADYAAKRAEALSSRGFYTAPEAQDAIAHLNKSLESFYKNPSYETANRAGVDSLIVNNIRKSLDEAIEGVSGAGYQDLKNTYGALKTIEKEVNHRAIVDARKNIKGLLDFTDVMTSGELISGIMAMNPVMIARGAGGRGIKEYFKRLNNPDRIVKGMFSDAEKILTKSAIQPEMRSGLGKLWQGEKYTGPDITGPYPGGMEVGPVRSGVTVGRPYDRDAVFPRQLPAGQGFEMQGGLRNPDIIDANFSSSSRPVLQLPPGQSAKEPLLLPEFKGFELRPTKEELSAILAKMKAEAQGRPKSLPPGQGFELVEQPKLKAPTTEAKPAKVEPIGSRLREIREKQKLDAQRPPITSKSYEGALGRIMKDGGIKDNADYNSKLLRQSPDGKRVMRKNGVYTADEWAQILTSEGFTGLETGDKLIQAIESGKIRNAFTPEKADSIIERNIRRQEHEWINKELSKLEAKEGIDTTAERESLSNHKARAIDEIREQGIINPANEETALKEIEDFFAEVSGKKQNPTTSKTKGKLAANSRQDTSASRGVLTKPKE